MKKTLEEEARQIRRDYLRDWRRKNPEKVREANRRYWERRARLKLEKEGRDNE